jgi:hypothetical protein
MSIQSSFAAKKDKIALESFKIKAFGVFVFANKL